MTDYDKYRVATLRGEHGSTAQFWMMYVYLVHIFLRFSRACRTNDVDLFVYTLSQMCPIFISANHTNYARWMVKYYLNLVNMEVTHPGIREVFENGVLSVRITGKSFARTPVDITLQQTVNAYAASRSTGIASFGQSDPARRRWMITRSVCSAKVGHLLKVSGMKAADDISKSLKPYRITKDNEDLQKLIDGIENTMNPFSIEPDENLYCIATGVKVADDIKVDLLSFIDKGRMWHDEFVNGCFDNDSRFEKTHSTSKSDELCFGSCQG